jgi:hypothetical protein
MRWRRVQERGEVGGEEKDEGRAVAGLAAGWKARGKRVCGYIWRESRGVMFAILGWVRWRLEGEERRGIA